MDEVKENIYMVIKKAKNSTQGFTPMIKKQSTFKGTIYLLYTVLILLSLYFVYDLRFNQN